MKRLWEVTISENGSEHALDSFLITTGPNVGATNIIVGHIIKKTWGENMARRCWVRSIVFKGEVLQ